MAESPVYRWVSKVAQSRKRTIHYLCAQENKSAGVTYSYTREHFVDPKDPLVEPALETSTNRTNYIFDRAGKLSGIRREIFTNNDMRLIIGHEDFSSGNYSLKIRNEEQRLKNLYQEQKMKAQVG